MRDANFKAVATNKAAVTITTSLYDRRALDVTADKPLVNSLNYLTYLVSSLPKVRETLSKDGGIERLIEILHECHNSTFSSNDSVFHGEKMLLTGWKWTLAFQCLVLIGTRGTEKIRTKVVDAGILPIIATVLDNYVSLNERMFIHANSRQQAPLSHTNSASGVLSFASSFGALESEIGATNLNATGGTTEQESSQMAANSTAPVYDLTSMQVIHEQQQARVQAQTRTHQSQPHQSQPHASQTHHSQQHPSQPNPPQSHASQAQSQAIHQPQAIPAQAMYQQQQQQHNIQHPQAQTIQQNVHQAFTQAQQPAQQIQGQEAQFQQRHQGLSTGQSDPHQSGTSSPVSTHSNVNQSIPQRGIPPHISRNTPLPQGAAAQTASPFPTHTPYIPYFNSSRQNNLTCDDYDNLSIGQLFKLIRFNSLGGHIQSPVHAMYCGDSAAVNSARNSPISTDLRKQYMIVNILKKLREEAGSEILDDQFYTGSELDMDNNLQFLSDMYLQDHEKNRSMMHAKVAVRHFTDTGVVIPRDDDIVWSLQLLAYISKYPYLKESLQNTHLVIDMSIRHKQMKLYLQKQIKLSLRKALQVKCRPTITPKLRRTRGQCVFKNADSAQVLNDSIDSQLILPETQKFGIRDPCDRDQGASPGATHGDGVDNAISPPAMGSPCLNIEEDAELEDDEDSNTDVDAEKECDNDNEFGAESADDVQEEKITECIVNNSGYLTKLFNNIVACESIENLLERKVTLHQINEKMSKFIEMEGKKLRSSIITKRKELKQFLLRKWDYDTYDGFDIDDNNLDQDDSLVEQEKINLFPLVEKFTFLLGTDIYYWAGVIMRNSCRRNEMSVRQCGNLDCGKWETRPREFLKCRRCKRTKYCSRECQMKLWHCHRNWCIPSTSSSSTHTTSTAQTSGAAVTVNHTRQAVDALGNSTTPASTTNQSFQEMSQDES